MITGGDLQNRQETVRAPVEERGKARKPKGETDTTPEQLAARIEAARNLRPPAARIEHCGHCWGEGRDAAIRAITGDDA